MTQTAELLDSHAEIARSRVEDLPETTSEGLRDVRDCCGEAVVSGTMYSQTFRLEASE